MKKYKDFLVTAEPFNSELLSSALWELDIDGLFEDVNCLHIYASEKSSISLDDVNRELDKLKNQNMIFNFSVEENIVADKNWNEEWEKSINVINVTDRITIKPTFREYNAGANEIVIIIDPKMSFGTGEHQTTKLMLTMLEKYAVRGQKVLDVGSGTGVLAIAAIMLGAQSAVAVDNDEWCLMNGKENAALNNVENKVETRLGVIDDVAENDFDIIVANIQKNILLEISDAIKKRINAGGFILLSGLLEQDEPDILNAYSGSGISFIEKLQMDDWIALAFKA